MSDEPPSHRADDMDARYYLNPETGLPHIYDHGVTEAEAEWVIANAQEDKASVNNSRQALGKTEAGRVLRVIYVKDEEGDGIFIVTAYPLVGKQRRAFRRRRRRRGQ